MNHPYDALLVVSFGGPEKRDDVVPFLENVLRGRNVPRARLLEVAGHYYHFDGRSPINQQNRDLIAALQAHLDRSGPHLPIYWGNRNWRPLLADTIRQMRDDGVKRALAFVTSVFSSYSGCRQYRENIEAARDEVGAGAPIIDKIRPFYNHPLFLEAMADRVREALPAAELVFTAHSVPTSMAIDARYIPQLTEACMQVATLVGINRWSLAWQSRSGPPTQLWLEPDISAYLRNRADTGDRSSVVIAPIGFLSDHIEVLWDLDVEAAATCRELGIPMRRCPTVGTHPKFVEMIRELILERLEPQRERRALGSHPPCGDICPPHCCPAPPPTTPRRVIP
ncbi:MAG: ferrochelatase [Bryobacterales bacterium]|nr:ferrochelatase [Bryobacterales bacterium]